MPELRAVRLFVRKRGGLADGITVVSSKRDGDGRRFPCKGEVALGSASRVEEGIVADVWVGLVLALVSALAINWAYTIEHKAAAALPPLSFRRPLQSLGYLVHSRLWLMGFATETAGWLVYVAALRLAPLSLVQAVSASGIAVLALLGVRGHPSLLSRHERLAVGLALIGLVLLAVSLIGSTPSSHTPHPAAVVVWLGASAGAASALIVVRLSLARAAALGLAAGLLFADGDISAKLVSLGGIWFLALISLILCYAAGTGVLQTGFQHGSALTAAGLATLATNAVPIAAGFVLFHESLPGGAKGFVQVAAFACIVASAAFLGRAARPDADPFTDSGRERSSPGS
jgi:drug/metabolite transporter (DMT)-like permease